MARREVVPPWTTIRLVLRIGGAPLRNRLGVPDLDP
jgi:hypothetical protein